MTNNENLIPIPGRLHSVATEGHVSGANEIYDDTLQKDQATINAENSTALEGKVDKEEGKGLSANDYSDTEKAKVSSHESALAAGGSVDTRITAAVNALDAEASQAAGSDGLSLSVSEADGKITSISGSIASNTYDTYGAASTAKSELLGDASTDYNTLGKLEDAIQTEATTRGNAINSIEGLIPSQATSSNQLADKEFVNSSISTATATFRGTSEAGLTETQFLTWANSLAKDLNDYVFWNTVDTTGNTQYKRYKYDGTQWAFEYTLNNSSFTAAQWAAIESGMTEALKDKLVGLPTSTEISQQINAEAVARASADSAINTTIGTDSISGTVKGRIKVLEDAVGTGGSVDSRIANAKSEIKGSATSACDTLGKAEALIGAEQSRAQSAEAALDSEKADKATTLAGYGITDAYTISETYTKTEVNGLVDTPHQEYVTVDAYASLPATGSKDTIYRVSNYNGSTSQVDASVYSEYAWNGTQYIFLCVKSQIEEVFDISVYNNNAKYADLATALNGGANIPQSLQKGGMSVKFVQSSDNKYVQCRLMSNEWSTNIENWAIAEEGVYVENPEFVYVKTDAEGKILEGIKTDGTKVIGGDLQVNGNIINEGIQGQIDAAIEEMQEEVNEVLEESSEKLSYFESVDNPEWINVTTDAEGKILEGITSEGKKKVMVDTEYPNGIPSEIKEYVNNHAGQNKVKVGTNEDFSKISDAIAYANEHPNTLVEVEPGVYDLIAELGSDYYANMPNAYYQGLRLGNGVTLKALGNGVVIKAQYTGSNVYVGYQFSIFNVSGTCTVDGIDFIGQNIRYIIHDDLPASQFPEVSEYIVTFSNCKFNHKGSTMYDPMQSIPVAVGGGCTKNSVHTWENCVFESEGLTSNGYDLNYHNSSNCDSKIIIKDNYFSNNNSFKVRVMGSNPGTIEVLVGENRMTKEPVIEDSALISVKHITSNDSLSETGLFDVAKGNLIAFGTYQSELDASPCINDASKFYVDYTSKDRHPKNVSQSKLIVGMNHDDLNPSDYIGHRKIYNKYGFTANFNFILKPFESKDECLSMTQNIKKLVDDGNTIGLHAINKASYWFINRLFDVRPDSTSTFAPSLTELKGSNEDGTGTNAFGVNITADTLVNSIGYNDLPGRLGNIKVVELTQENLNEINSFYTHYGDTATISGLDLTDTIVSKTSIQWLEYWYNNLIDKSLGYSSTVASIADKFAEDYTGTYPTKSEITSGVITSNGVFTKGLFKGCQTCCNYEVIDRCIDIARAFMLHYFGFDTLSHYHRHGVKFYGNTSSYNGLNYMDASHQFVYDVKKKLYSTRLKTFVSPSEIFVSRGIKSTYDIFSNVVSDIVLYDRSKGKLPDYCTGWNITAYLNSVGTDVSRTISYSDFTTFMSGVNNWQKFLYDNAGKEITNNAITLNVFSILRSAISYINSSLNTGCIPILSWDTLNGDAAISTALDLLLRYCYLNNINVVSVAKAKEMANSLGGEELRENYFPNPMFSQSIKRTVGDVNIAIPDGWGIQQSTGNPTVSVSSEDNSLVVSTQADELIEIWTKIYNLPAGSYNLKMSVKGSGTNSIGVYKKLNRSSRWFPASDLIDSVSGGTDYMETTIPFIVNDYHRNPENEADDMNIVCGGYEDNFAYIQILINCSNGGSVSIKDCSIVKL